jgi:drug/metabolite transporter (DMT)-like permease
MALYQIAMLLCVLLAMATGQVLFKISADQAANASAPFLFSIGTNLTFVGALGLYGLGTLLWVYILSSAALSKTYPWMALSFVLTPLFAAAFLSEPISARFIIGTFIIILGILVVTA